LAPAEFQQTADTLFASVERPPNTTDWPVPWYFDMPNRQGRALGANLEEGFRRHGVDIEAMLGLENIKDQLGCDDVACAAQIGGALGAELLLTGRVAKLGDSIIVVLKLIDTQQNKVLGSAKHKVADDENLYEGAIETSARQLFGLDPAPAPAPTQVVPTEVGVVRITTDPSGAEAYLDGKPVGTTPVTVPSIVAGIEHLVRIEIAGWVPHEERITVVRGETRPLEIRLIERPRGRQGWFAAPFVGEGLRLMVDNNYSTTFTKIGLSTG
jgi:hypothetical protein